MVGSLLLLFMLNLNNKDQSIKFITIKLVKDVSVYLFVN